MEEHTIIYHHGNCILRSTGTLEKLVAKDFPFRLLAGHAKDSTISLKPMSFTELVDSLNKAAKLNGHENVWYELKD